MTRGTLSEAAVALGVNESGLRRDLAFAGYAVRGSLVVLHAKAAEAWGLPPAAPARSVWVGPGGAVCRVNEDGSISELLPGGHPHGGAASDPSNTSEEP